MVNLLALDLGIRCGWAASTSVGITSGVQNFTLRRGESPGMRDLHFERWLQGMIELVKPRVIGYELPHYRGGAATRALVGFETDVQKVCAALNIEHQSIHTGTLKKFATGSGGANKADMVEAAQTKLGYEGADDNEVDALWALHWLKADIEGDD